MSKQKTKCTETDSNGKPCRYYLPCRNHDQKQEIEGQKTEDLEAMSLEAIAKYKYVFLEDVISKLPVSKPIFYKYKLNELDSIKKAIEQNKIELKTGLRQKMYSSDSPTAWIALYKIIGTDEESHRLNGSKQELQANVNLKSISEFNNEADQRLKEAEEAVKNRQ